MKQFVLAVRLTASLLSLSFAVACSSPTSPSGASLRVNAITPTAGSTTGDTEVTVSGAGFSSDASVTVGGVPVRTVIVQNATTLLVTIAPRGSAGTADVVVLSGGHSATLPAAFTFIAPSGANRPPIISGFQSVGSRRSQPSGFADVGETVTVSASVSNEGIGTLNYVWSGPGTFTGTGPTVSWTAPGSLSTPSTQGLTLTVTERYDEAGVTHTNTTSNTFPMRVHDSQKEILDMGEDFLTLFSQSEVPTSQVLHNFSTTCDGGRGRRDEARDTDSARSKYRQDFSKFRISRNPPVTFNFGSACLAFGSRIRPADACSLFTVHWEFVYLVPEDSHKAGDHGVTDGMDHVTAVLEGDNWKLCHSDFQ